MDVNITDTASAADSQLARWRVGGSTRVKIEKSGQVMILPSAVSALVIPGGTVTASAPLIDMAQTWNNAAGFFTAFRLAITKTAAVAGSRLLDLQVDGASKFMVRKDNVVELTGKPILTLSSGNYHNLCRQDGTPGVMCGGTADKRTYYDNDTHRFRDTAGAIHMEVSSFGIDGYGTGGTKVGRLDFNSNFGGIFSLVAIGATAVIDIFLNGVNRWRFQPSGQFNPVADNAYDIGSSGLRIRNIYVAGNVLVTVNTGLKFDNHTNGAAAAAGTLTNAPVAGNPTFWIPVNVGGVTKHIPAW